MASKSDDSLTLTDVTHVGRLVVKYGAIALVAMIVLRFFFSSFIAVWQALNPEPPPPPTVGFGILPPLRFPEKAVVDKPSSYRLETATGSLPSFGDRAKVLFMPQSNLGLLADQKARQLAASYEFVFEPDVLSSRLYRWSKTQPLQSTLQLDIQTNQMKFSTNYLARPELLVNAQVPDSASGVDVVKNFLRSGDLLSGDIATSSGEVVYLKNGPTEPVPAVSFSDADYLQVDLNRAPIDGYRMYTPNGYQGIVSAIVGGAFKGNQNIYQLSYNYHPVDYTEVHTYPLRPTSEAWQVLQAGEGYVANKGDNDIAIVRDVTLGYYDDFEEQAYLQPVYVFEGDDGFLGYVPALNPNWIQQNQANLETAL